MPDAASSRRRRSPGALGLLALAPALAASAGCAAAPPAAPVTPASSEVQQDLELLGSPLLSLATPGDAVVRVVGPQMACSGTLIEDDLVLTAHHCVVVRGERGERTDANLHPADLEVELGGDDLPWGNVGVKAVLTPPCGESGGRGDVAVLVLERKLIGMPTFALSDAPPRAGEAVLPQGFGRCALSAEGIRRREREGGAVSVVSPGTFEALASVCPGDSGGPVLDRATREVVGVVSLSAMDHDETTRARSIFARVDRMPRLVAYARSIADGADPTDLPPLACDP